jgi:ubiquinone/menaquinone biosynthesis C-methylase UbiE
MAPIFKTLSALLAVGKSSEGLRIKASKCRNAMALYRDRVLPCLTHLAMSNRWLIEYRRRLVSQARGRVLEIGIGSGLNLRFYGEQVASVYGIDPSAALLRRAARHAAVRAEFVEASAEIIPFDHHAFDTVATWTLCTIPQAISALCEMRRVLRQDGRLLFVEHGLAPDRGVAWWQHRLTPCWKCLGGGCHLNRKIDDLVTASGFHIDELDTGYMQGRNHSPSCMKASPGP